MEQLTITRYALKKDGTYTNDAQATFAVMLNPSKLERSVGVRYNQDQAFQSTQRDQKLNVVDNETLSFSIVIDGTGAVANKPGMQFGSVDAQLKQLRAVVGVDAASSPQAMGNEIVWGELKFRGRLQSLGVTHKLFAANGVSLRAEVALAFVSAVSTKEAELSAAAAPSAAVSQERETRAGDTLPLLCLEVYGDAAYCVDVARFNGLATLRTLPAGTQLVFPPLAPAL